jgi:hypothetical protein
MSNYLRGRDEFGVRHFAGEVIYSVTGFLDKNKDSISSDFVDVVTSPTSVVLPFFSESGGAAPSAAAAAAAGVAGGAFGAGGAGAAGAGSPDGASVARAGHSRKPTGGTGLMKVSLGSQFRTQVRTHACTHARTHSTSHCPLCTPRVWQLLVGLCALQCALASVSSRGVCSSAFVP